VRRGVRVDPVHLRARFPGMEFGAVEGHAGDVECGHVPPLARQPDRVCALTAADVEGPPGLKRGYLGDEGAVGLPAPDPLLLGVALVPVSAPVVVGAAAGSSLGSWGVVESGSFDIVPDPIVSPATPSCRFGKVAGISAMLTGRTAGGRSPSCATCRAAAE
jgi:hypothetical protein